MVDKEIDIRMLIKILFSDKIRMLELLIIYMILSIYKTLIFIMNIMIENIARNKSCFRIFIYTTYLINLLE